MARPNIESDPRYVELVADLSPRKGRIERAKAEAARIVADAYAADRSTLLAAVHKARQAGLSDYAIGKASGFTSADAKAKLFSEVDAFYAGDVPDRADAARAVLDAHFSDAGWTATLQNVAGDPWRAEWLVQHPNGETGLFASYPVAGGGFAVDAVDYEQHHAWKVDMPDAVLYGMFDWRPL